MRDKQLAQFLKDRDAALLSLDSYKIRAFYHKYGMQMPKDDHLFWVSVHKAICHMSAASYEQKLYSSQWLIVHGYSPDI